MDDKTINYVVANALAVNKCLDEIGSIKKALIRQTKINRQQRSINMILAGVSVFCICKIIELVAVVNSHEESIRELENADNGEDPKKQKGE